MHSKMLRVLDYAIRNILEQFFAHGFHPVVCLGDNSIEDSEFILASPFFIILYGRLERGFLETPFQYGNRGR